MKKKYSPVIVGLFVVGFFLLAGLAVLSFGGKKIFRNPARFVVEAKNVSVGGLDPGAAVKLSGVQVGRVESVSVSVNPESAEFDVRIVCELADANAIAVFGPEAGQTERLIERLVERGLQAGLKLAGITGLLYVDLEMRKVDELQPVKIDEATGAPVVPLAASILDEYLDTFEEIISGLAEVDFKGISDRTTTLLDNLNAMLVEADVPHAVRTIEGTATAWRAVAEETDLKGAAAAFGRAATALETTLGAINEATPEVGASLVDLAGEMSATLEVMKKAGEQVRDLTGPRGGLPTEFGRTMMAIQDLADRLTELVEYIERNPDALIKGRAVEHTDE